MKSIDHLFVGCPISIRVLEGAVQHGWLSDEFFGLGSNLCDQLQLIGSGPNTHKVALKISFLLWSIYGRAGII